MVAREVAPQDRRRDLPTDPRDGWREFSLGRAPRIHGELLKLGITVSQAYCIAIYAALAENLTRPSQRNQRALFAPII